MTPLLPRVRQGSITAASAGAARAASAGGEAAGLCAIGLSPGQSATSTARAAAAAHAILIAREPQSRDRAGQGDTGAEGLSKMPGLANVTTIGQLTDIVAYLKSLKDGTMHDRSKAIDGPGRDMKGMKRRAPDMAAPGEKK
jgi:hypothetical protein